MPRLAICAESLSKAYRIGLKEDIADTLMSAALGWVRRPIQNLRRLQRLNTFNANGEDRDIIWALNKVSFEINEGEVVGIIGRNGAGKSTLLKILSRITEPTAGKAVIRGRVSSLLEVGTGFHPELTGRENIYMNGTILGMTKREIDSRFDEIVDFSGVEKFLDTPIKRYSSGMQVRLAFSVAAHLEPQILIIDEVLAVGDVEFQRKCLGKMQDVARGGRTVLIVSHNMAAIESLCSQAFLLVNGRLEARGTVDSIIEAYHSEVSRSVSVGNDEILLRNCNHLKSVKLLDAQGCETNIIRLGSEFHAVVKLLRPIDAKNVRVGIGIDGSMGTRILTLSSPTLPLTYSGNGHEEVHCKIEQLPIPPGHYNMKIVVYGYDEVANVSPFFVLDCDAFGQGHGFQRGSCVAPSTWWADGSGADSQA